LPDRFTDGSTMTVNNVCRTLIAFGSYVPGGEKHAVFSGLPGKWKKGKILCDLIDPPDSIGRGENDEIEAWTIEFSDCKAKLFTPEHETQERLLYERWMALDRAMGSDWARDQWRWWPKGRKPLAGKNGMIVVNIYVPLKNFPHLANREEVPSPDEEDDIHSLWTEVKAQRKRYADSLFYSLIKDATPDQYLELFGDLPGGTEFIRKLRLLYQEHQKGSGNLLWDGESEYFSLYVCPLEKHRLPQNDLMELVKADVANRAGLLRKGGFADEAETVESLTFAFGKPQSGDQIAADALFHAADIIRRSRAIDSHWFWCLDEACYGIAASYELAGWLMSHWYDVEFDFEPAYRIWKAAGIYKVAGDTCYVDRSS
jgi:hypothetical protein